MATYRVILEQNPSSILMSDPIGPEKSVVENFDSISPGLLSVSPLAPTRSKFGSSSQSLFEELYSPFYAQGRRRQGEWVNVSIQVGRSVEISF